MPRSDWRIEPLGDRALIVRFGDRVDAEISARLRAVARQLMAARIAGIDDVVPAFTTLALHYQPAAFGAAPHERVSRLVSDLLQSEAPADATAARVVDVPVCYGGEFGPDLADVAAACGLGIDEVIARHAASPHVVHMLGFAPGFPYMGGLDARLALPRRATPRTAVPAGSVAIARDQSAIYPLQAPGGWNLIGRTPLVLFDPQVDPPCLLQPGDQVRFVPITPAQFDAAVAQRS